MGEEATSDTKGDSQEIHVVFESENSWDKLKIKWVKIK